MHCHAREILRKNRKCSLYPGFCNGEGSGYFDKTVTWNSSLEGSVTPVIEPTLTAGWQVTLS